MFEASAAPRLKRIVRAALFPWRAGWGTANRLGLLGEAPVGTAPHLDSEALTRWRELLASTKVYLEYGSGGSTVEASRMADHVFSVETDGRYLNAVEAKVASTRGSKAALHPIHVDIGWTEKWGRPILSLPTRRRLAKWRSYSEAPWLQIEDLGLVPGFIFVDGRFRAASVLDSLLRLPKAADCLFMLDDFEQRQRDYGIVLPFVSDAEQVGRALVFRRPKRMDRAACAEALAKAQRDPE